MIQDPALARLFKAESEEHLARLDAGLLRLEQASDDAELVESLFREAHSFKGAARMLGLGAIEHSAHELETMLNAARKGELALDAGHIGRLEALLGKITGQVREALADEATSAPAARPDQAPAPPVAGGEDFRIDTVRVETGRLDRLLTLVGELGVLDARSGHRRALLDGALERLARLERGRHAPRGPAGEALGRLGEALQAVREALQEDAARLDAVHADLLDGVLAARLLPLSTVFGLFPRMVHDLARETGKQAELELAGEQITVDKRILEQIKDPLMHLLRNALVHGIEAPAERARLGKPVAGRIRLVAERHGEQLVVAVGDDGRGLDPAAIREAARAGALRDEAALAAMDDEALHALVFEPGFSTIASVTELAGRGVGLDVVRANVERLKGGVALESRPGEGTRVTLRLPVSVSRQRLLLVQAAGRHFGLPVDAVHAMRRLPAAARYTLEGRASIDFDGGPLFAPHLAEVLALGVPERAGEEGAHIECVVLRAGDERLAVVVDTVLAEEPVIVRPLGAPLKRVRNVAGLAPLASGELAPVLDAGDLLRSAARLAAAPAPTVAPVPATRHRVLLAEDAALVRAMEKRILEDAGYDVVTAVDGAEALAKLRTDAFAALVSDVQMPNLDGLALTERVRADARLRTLPVILVTALASDADRRRGLEVGANAYIPKPSFDQQVLVSTLRRLI